MFPIEAKSVTLHSTNTPLIGTILDPVNYERTILYCSIQSLDLGDFYIGTIQTNYCAEYNQSNTHNFLQQIIPANTSVTYSKDSTNDDITYTIVYLDYDYRETQETPIASFSGDMIYVDIATSSALANGIKDIWFVTAIVFFIVVAYIGWRFGVWIFRR